MLQFSNGDRRVPARRWRPCATSHGPLPTSPDLLERCRLNTNETVFLLTASGTRVGMDLSPSDPPKGLWTWFDCRRPIVSMGRRQLCLVQVRTQKRDCSCRRSQPNMLQTQKQTHFIAPAPDAVVDPWKWRATRNTLVKQTLNGRS